MINSPTTRTDLNGTQPDDFENPQCEDFFYFTTHAECGSDSGTFGNPDLIEVREEIREAKERKNEVFDCTLAKKDTKPDHGTCPFSCTSEERKGIGGSIIPLHRIQKACPPARDECPLSLKATFSHISVFGLPLELGFARVVKDSCVYGMVQ